MSVFSLMVTQGSMIRDVLQVAVVGGERRDKGAPGSGGLIRATCLCSFFLSRFSLSIFWTIRGHLGRTLPSFLFIAQKVRHSLFSSIFVEVC